MTQSLAQGAVVHLERTETIADGLAAPFVGEYTLAQVQRFVDEVVLVSDEEIKAALRLILEQCKLFAEPAGAVGVAALLAKKVVIPPGAQVVCLLSGGNMDRSRRKRAAVRGVPGSDSARMWDHWHSHTSLQKASGKAGPGNTRTHWSVPAHAYCTGIYEAWNPGWVRPREEANT